MDNVRIDRLAYRLVIDLCGFFQLDMMLPVAENRKWNYICLGIGER